MKVENMCEQQVYESADTAEVLKKVLPRIPSVSFARACWTFALLCPIPQVGGHTEHSANRMAMLEGQVTILTVSSKNCLWMKIPSMEVLI